MNQKRFVQLYFAAFALVVAGFFLDCVPVLFLASVMVVAACVGSFASAKTWAALAVLALSVPASAGPSHETWTRAALGRLPQTPDDRASATRAVELDALAASIAAVSKGAPRPPREWAALLLTVGSHETNFAGRLLRGECRLEKRECDAAKGKDGKLFARARGWGQVWRNTRNAPLWDAAETDVVAQTKLVDHQLRSAYWTCARSGQPWATATLNAYFGVRCGATWPGLDKRLATFNRVIGQ
jgi:hypothetical protein